MAFLFCDQKSDMKISKNKENTILYELLIYSEWTQEPEILGKTKNDRSNGNRGTFWGWLNSFSMSSTVPPSIQKLVNLQMPWQFAVGGEGKVVAILQDQCIEIRSSRDEYGTIIGRCNIPNDLCPQWRKISWSPDCSMLALALSNGSIYFFDLLGSQLFTLHAGKKARKGHSHDISNAIVGMVFTDVRIKNTQWSSEFLVATHKGKLYSFLVSPTDGFQEGHVFCFWKRYPRGITGIAHHPAHQLLFVSGEIQFSNANETPSKGFHYGITAWRFLSDFPHYQLVTTLDDEINLGKRLFLNKFSTFSFYGSVEEDWIFKMSISPNGQLLAASHTSGLLTLWKIPSLTLIRMWELNDQPGRGTVNPYSSDSEKKKSLPSFIPDSVCDVIADINWWSDDALIVARFSGALTVSSVASLTNQLGSAIEWFEPSPQVSLTYNTAFLALECECSVSSKVKQPSGTSVEESSEEDSDVSLWKQIFRAITNGLYFLTDIERFQPPKKKKKMLSKSFRLICLKSTTPEELFTRKIDNEEYGEALVLAKMYDLDCDLVYQRQWRKSSASVSAIQDYLTKIKKRQWVLHECLEKVPENIDAAKELILYGLRGTNIETLIAIGEGEDQGRFISSYQGNYDSEVNIENLLMQVDFDRLTLEQKQLCQYRLKLFSYLDRLSTYEIILGGAQAAEDNYIHNFFKTFRSQSGFEAAIAFARSGDGKALSSMLTYHGAQTLKHWLVILSNFPETTPPSEYRNILPEAGYGSDEPDVYFWDELSIRDKDWCELHAEKLNPRDALDEFEEEFYEECPEMLKYRQLQLTSELLTEWYSERAKDIVRMSGLVDSALELVKYGRERNIKGLEKLHDDLVTMETLVYDCQLEKYLPFDQLEAMTDMEKIQLLMSASTEQKYVRNVRQWLMPFLKRVDKHELGSKIPLLRKYLISVAKMDFVKCKLFFQDSKPDQLDPLIENLEDLLSLALDCMYSCERKEDLHSCFAILECLPERSSIKNPTVDSLHDKIDQMEKHLSVAETLSRYDINATPAYIRECESSPEEVRKLFVRVTTAACNKMLPLSDAQWKELLKNMLDMRFKVFTCITAEVCFEVIVEALLNSNKKDNIILSSHLMECGQKPAPGNFFKSSFGLILYNRKLPFERSVALILAAARIYFNDASTLADSSIILASTCLNLVEDDHPAINEEHDLIASLSLLQEFSVNLIPLQVRLCPNKLDLIERALKSKVGAYKSCQKLLRLSMLLRLCGDNKVERDGKVLTLVSKAAFEDENYSFCYQTCQQIMELRYEGGWSVCQQLAQCSNFEENQSKFELFNYALTFCTSDLLESLLISKKELELQDLQLRLSSLTTPNHVSQLNEEGSKATKDGIVHDVLHSATQTTKEVISTFGSKQFWKDAVKWINPLTTGEDESCDTLDSNKDLKTLGVPAFYESLFSNCHLSKHDATYNKYVMPDVPKNVKIGLDLLRASMTECQTVLPSSVLLDLFSATVSEDFVLSLSFLLSLNCPSEANRVFEKINSSVVGLELAVYHFALSVMGSVFAESKKEVNFYGWDFNTIVNETEKYTGSNDNSEDLKLFLHYKRQLMAHIQAEVLRKLHRQSSVEIDVARFSSDDAYMRETILQLGKGTEEVFRIAKNLAKQYNFSLFELYMVRLDYLLQLKSIGIVEVKNEIEKHGLMQVLLSKPEDFVKRMYDSILPSVDTTDRLKLCYELLQKYGDEPDGKDKRPSLHLKLMKKLESLGLDINYAYLMSPEKSTSILRNLLANENLSVFMKISTHISCEDGFHSPSSVSSLWAEKMFFYGNTADRKQPNSFSEWVHRYETCGELFQKMTATDFLRFINAITFDNFAVHELPEASRVEITKRAVRHCKQRESPAKGSKEKGSWTRAAQEFQNNLEHLKKLEDSLVSNLRETDESYATKFDMTRSLPNKMEELLLQAVMECRPITTLQTLLALAPVELAMDTADAFSKAITLVSEELRQASQHPYLVGKQPLKVLQSVLSHVLDDGDILSEDSIFELLHPLCQDNSISFETRISVIELMENMLDLSEEDTAALLLAKTRALVPSAWPDIEVVEENMETMESKYKLFEELFSSSNLVHQVRTLARLLLYWPILPQAKTGDPTVNIWVRVLKLLISQGTKEDLDEVIRLVKKITRTMEFSEKCYWTLYHSIAKKNMLHNLKLAMLTRNRYFQKSALQDLTESKTFSETDFDSELLDWILEQQLITETVNTPVYKILVEHIVSNCMESTVIDLVKELRTEGHKAEADSLLALYKERSRPRTAGGLRSAISSLTRWLPGSDA